MSHVLAQLVAFAVAVDWHDGHPQLDPRHTAIYNLQVQRSNRLHALNEMPTVIMSFSPLETVEVSSHLHDTSGHGPESEFPTESIQCSQYRCSVRVCPANHRNGRLHTQTPEVTYTAVALDGVGYAH
jgi:hypothetical protein